MKLLVAAIIAVALHEGSHALCAWLLGVRVKRMGINWRGPYLVRESGSEVQNLAITFAGPAMNLLLTGSIFLTPWLGLGCIRFAFVNFVLGFSNLLPLFPGCDGHRALRLLRQHRGGAR